MPYGRMARTRRSRGSKRTFPGSTPSTSTGSNSGSAPSSSQSGRRSAAIAAANVSKSASGRTTQNSRGNRGRRGAPSSKRSQTLSKPTNGRGRGRTTKKEPNTLQDPITYKDENGEVYKKGGVFNKHAKEVFFNCILYSLLLSGDGL